MPLPQKVILRLQRGEESSEGEKRDRDIHILLDPTSPLVWWEASRPHKSPDPLAETLTAWTVGRRLEEITCNPRQRTMDLRLAPPPSEEGSSGILRILLHGSKPRLLFLEGDDLVHKYPGGKIDAGAGTTVGDRPWIFESSLPHETVSALQAEKGLSRRSDEQARRLARLFRGCDIVLAREILWRASAGKDIAGALESLHKEYQDLDETSDLHLYLWQDPDSSATRGRLSGLRLEHLEKEKDLQHTTADPVQQCTRWGRMVQKQRAFDMLQKGRRGLIHPLLKSLTRLAKKLVEEKRHGERAETWRLWAEALLVHAAHIAKGSRVAQITNPRDPEETLEIPLDTKLTAPENADVYFHKARREEKARPVREARLKLVETMVGHLAESEGLESPRAWRRWADRGDQLVTSATKESQKAQQDKPTPPGEDLILKWKTMQRKLVILLETPKSTDTLEDVLYRLLPSSERGKLAEADEVPSRREPVRRPGKRKEGPGFHPRQYVTRDGWKVYVGRTNQENDYVTHVFARPDDIWFHVHGASGSHVILRREGRKDNPSAKTLEEVASIAARYSQARHSKKVPVVYTLKKYVRKPRKAPAGLALCTREKTIMVEPADEEELKSLMPRKLDRDAPDS
jgi:predicted ribosome quality control (RQC) complex YloA/Tae2 family protein